MATRLSQYRAVTPATVEQRAAQRHRVTVKPATIQKRGGRPAKADLHDLSIYGCRLACRIGHGEGTPIWLSLRDDSPIPATVVWNDGAHIGCRFDAPIDRRLVRELTLVIC